MRPPSRRLSLAAALALIGAGAAAAVISSSGGDGGGPAIGHPGRSRSNTRFAALSAAHSNRCQLQAPQVMAMRTDTRLQGSCCFPMDEASYSRQLRGLRRYASMPRLVPSDPYDIPVALAQRLLRYRSIPLTGGERAAYGLAVRRSDTRGPCCCPCWRWQAFSGQARYLLHRRGFSGARVGRLWDLEQGCGGPSESKT